MRLRLGTLYGIEASINGSANIEKQDGNYMYDNRLNQKLDNKFSDDCYCE